MSPRARPRSVQQRLLDAFRALTQDTDVSTPPDAKADSPEPSSQSELEFFTELCAVVAEQNELQPILDWVVRRATKLLGADECTIKLIDPGMDLAKTYVTNRSSGASEAGAASWPRPLKESVMGYLMQPSAELATSDIVEDPRFAGVRDTSSAVRALIAVPLRAEGRVTGMIAASESKPGRQWSRHEQQLLSILASHSAIVIEKARLRIEAGKKDILEIEKQAMDKELGVAHDIQMRLVPGSPLRCGSWEVDGRLVPARHVGGDFYDYFELGPGRVAMVIGDVAGKGVPAAILVSTVHSAFRAYAGLGLEPRPLIEQLNRRVADSVASGRFVTLFYAEIDLAGGRIRFINAGHVFPRLRRANGTLEMLPAGGVPLGIFQDAVYEQGECRLEAGDSLLVYSDGIPDAEDMFRQEYGDERVDALWGRHGGGPAGAVLDRLMSEVISFSGSTAQTDDQTAMVLCPVAGG